MHRTETFANEPVGGAPETSLEPGQTIAKKYRIESVLGTGGMGTVVAATHIGLDERVAIKVLHGHLVRDAGAVGRFMREARAAAKLKSPCAARVLDVDVLPNGVPYIVMEHLEGADLSARIAAGAVPIDDAVRYVLQACEAVCEAHAVGIIHRDLKPANLFLCRDFDGKPQIKVLDFGVSRILDDSSITPGFETEADVVVGSRSYMAPEQHESARKADQRSDIWALGVILHELLTGGLPYVGESASVVYAMILTTEPPSVRTLLPEVPEGLANVVLRCLRRAPEARYANIVALAEALQPYSTTAGVADRIRAIAQARAKTVTDATVVVSPSPLASSAASPATEGPVVVPLRRRGSPAVVAAAVALLVIGIGAVAVLRGDDRTAPARDGANAPVAGDPAATARTAVPARSANGGAATPAVTADLPPTVAPLAPPSGVAPEPSSIAPKPSVIASSKSAAKASGPPAKSSATKAPTPAPEPSAAPPASKVDDPYRERTSF